MIIQGFKQEMYAVNLHQGFQSSPPVSQAGKLSIVSTGPGDPKHVTLQAIETIQKADLVLARPEEAQKVDKYLKGKTVEGPERWSRLWRHEGRTWVRNLPAFKPEEQCFIINKKSRERDAYIEELKEILAQGRNIVILDGGDPTVFSRFFFWLLEGFNEEQVEVVPGVGAMTAAFAALKKCSTGADARFVLQTAPGRLFGQSENDDLAKDLSRYSGTLVFYMALEDMNSLVVNLKKHYPPDLPVAVVYHAGFRDKEKVIRGTLDTILGLTVLEKEKWMGMVIVGLCSIGPSFLLPHDSKETDNPK
jgi:precorrin-4 methylase